MSAEASELAADALRLVDAEPARAFALAGEAVRMAWPTREHLTVAVAERARGLAPAPRPCGHLRRTPVEPRRAQRVVEQAVANLTGIERARALAQRGAIAQQLGRLDDALAD